MYDQEFLLLIEHDQDNPLEELKVDAEQIIVSLVNVLKENCGDDDVKFESEFQNQMVTIFKKRVLLTHKKLLFFAIDMI